MAEVNNKDRRVAPREAMAPIQIRAFTSLDHMTLVSRKGAIVEASTTGFLVQIERRELVPKEFQKQLSLDVLLGDQVMLMIDAMNLELGGKIVRTKRLTKDLFEVAVDYSADAPEYWREILVDMLPRGKDYD